MADGNSQFSSTLDQLDMNIESQMRLRIKVHKWLKENANFMAPGGECISKMLSGETWEEFLERIEKSGSLGNNLTLIAISNIFNVKILVSQLNSQNKFSFTPDEVKTIWKTIFLFDDGDGHYFSILPLENKSDEQEIETKLNKKKMDSKNEKQNCQYRAIMDQIENNEELHVELRKSTHIWMKENKKFLLPSGKKLSSATDKNWDELTNEVSIEGTWGTSITL